MEYQRRTSTTSISIKNVPRHVADGLRVRAKANHRSLQGELLAILEETLTPRRLTVDEAYQRIKELDFRTGSESTRIVRQERDAR